MQKLGLNEIREKFLKFYEGKGHYRLPSFPLVPQGDSSLLLINSGMAPLKPYFTGAQKPPSRRVTTCQKCIRTPDIERVGKTARHGTFFEMLGNFSFGDYFKKEATSWAWEFVTKELKMPIDKLWVTIYQEDDEAFEIWTKHVGIPAKRIVRMGKEDNFWEIGTGPCGPCSEIYFDRGAENGCGRPDCKVGCDCDRFVEFWNLVFTQFNRDENGNYTPLAHPNIDTGMGLERLAAIMQGEKSLFDVDTVKNIMKHIEKVSKASYGKSADVDISLRVITDHIRSTTFLVSDGVVPSNEGRGYVLRRLLRRAARHGKLLGVEKPFLYMVSETVINESGKAYPELIEKKDYIQKIIRIEEERFDQTINLGLDILNDRINELKAQGKTLLSGADAFKLYDTYGFPIDLTHEILLENQMEVDEQEFNHEMELQRKRAREARQEGDEAGWKGDIISDIAKSYNTEFVGYDNLSYNGKILAIVVDDNISDSVGVDTQAVIITDITPFYAESGGQIGDCGLISSKDGIFEVTTTKKTADGKHFHIGKVIRGGFMTGDTVALEVDEAKRRATSRNHSTTHLLHKALKDTLGVHVAQSGSYVAPDRLRFDFSHFSAMTDQELEEVEKKVNNAILSALPIEVSVMSMEDARKTGATALFGEKYGNKVRVVKMGDYSIELCGGCHLKNTAEAGLFKIISESSVAAGVRRIEGVTGSGVLEYIKEKDNLLADTAKVLKANNMADVAKKATDIIEELSSCHKLIEQLKSKMAKDEIENINYSMVGNIKVYASKFEGMTADGLRTIADSIKSKKDVAVIVLAGITEDKISFVATATKDAVNMGIHAGKIVGEVAKITDGRGGGKPDFAQAGGKDPKKIDVALSFVNKLVESMIK